MKNNTTIVKATTKGQITLPAKWRRKMGTDRFLLHENGDSLEVQPLDLDKLSKTDEYTVFDAIRDNKGKGIKAKDLTRLLKKMS